MRALGVSPPRLKFHTEQRYVNARDRQHLVQEMGHAQWETASEKPSFSSFKDVSLGGDLPGFAHCTLAAESAWTVSLGAGDMVQGASVRD